jgi:hypothetical protein
MIYVGQVEGAPGLDGWKVAREHFETARSEKCREYRMYFPAHYWHRVHFVLLLAEKISFNTIFIDISEINIFGHDSVYQAFANAWHVRFPDVHPFEAKHIYASEPSKDEFDYLLVLMTTATLYGFDMSLYSPEADLSVVTTHNDWMVVYTNHEGSFETAFDLMEYASKKNSEFGSLQRKSLFARMLGR